MGAAHPVPAGGAEVGGVMGQKVLNDAVAKIRALAQLRGRNVQWSEAAVRESVSLPEAEALREKVTDLVAPDLAALLSFVAFGNLPTNLAALFLIIFAAVLFFLDVKAPSHGVLTAGVACMLFGSLLLFPPWALRALPGSRPRS